MQPTIKTRPLTRTGRDALALAASTALRLGKTNAEPFAGFAPGRVYLDQIDGDVGPSGWSILIDLVIYPSDSIACPRADFAPLEPFLDPAAT